jgi:hypothetical protein
VGELLWRRIKPDVEGKPPRAGLVRARYRERRIEKEDGKTRIDKSYDLYIDRAMIEAEFDTLWAKQTALNPSVFRMRRAQNSRTACCINARSSPSSRAAARWSLTKNVLRWPCPASSAFASIRKSTTCAS